MFIIIQIGIGFILTVVLFLSAIWFSELVYSIWFMRESLQIAEREINALNVRLFKKEQDAKQCIHDAADVKVRLEEFEKRLNIIAKTNHSKLEKIERNCNSLASKFELFSQSTRKSIADLSKPGKAASSTPDSNKIAELESTINSICGGLHSMRDQIAQMKKNVATKTDVVMLMRRLDEVHKTLKETTEEHHYLTDNTYCIFRNLLRTMYLDQTDANDYSNHMFELNRRFYNANTVEDLSH
jgi:chromosome segregation ATPase